MTAALLVLLLLSGPSAARTEGVEPWRDPGENAMKSALVPGWGQFANAQPTKGRAFLGGALLALAVAANAVPIFEGNDQRLLQGIGLAAYFSLATSASWDAYQTAHRLNRENGYQIDAAQGRTLYLALVRLNF